MTKQTRMTKLSIAALALAISAATGSAIAAQATASSTAGVITPIAITKGADMSFGNFAASATPGTVTLSPNNALAFTGGIVAAGGSPAAARFDVTGTGTMTYSIAFTGSSTALTSGSDTMTFTRISDTSASAITSGNVTTGALTAGAQSIYVGGQLAVAANQPAGTYTGSVIATVEYN